MGFNILGATMSPSSINENQSTHFSGGHELDEDCVCVHCHFDAAEHHHMQRHLSREEREPSPPCHF